MQRRHLVIPLAAALALVPAYTPLEGTMATTATVLVAAALIAAVFSAVHHAEVVAHQVGEPFGTLILAVAVTVIEAALIVSMMLAGGDKAAAIARDAIYAAVMIIVTGVVGLCIVVAGVLHREPTFRAEGANAGLVALIAMAVLVLVLPSFTTSSPGPTYTTPQLVFAATASLVVWGLFVFVQTVRHRDYFLPPFAEHDEATHAPPPGSRAAWTSFALLVVALVAVVGLAKSLSPRIEAAVAAAGAPQAVIGIAIALLVLLPESLAAVNAARANRLQTSLNLAFGSALACVGLTIPVVAVVSMVLDLPLALGLDSKSIVLLCVALAINAITLAPGRTHVLEGAVLFVLFAAYLFLAVVP
jgi:Ca2+:H+ antiporter